MATATTEENAVERTMALACATLDGEVAFALENRTCASGKTAERMERVILPREGAYAMLASWVTVANVLDVQDTDGQILPTDACARVELGTLAQTAVYVPHQKGKSTRTYA